MSPSWEDVIKLIQSHGQSVPNIVPNPNIIPAHGINRVAPVTAPATYSPISQYSSAPVPVPTSVPASALYSPVSQSSSVPIPIPTPSSSKQAIPSPYPIQPQQKALEDLPIPQYKDYQAHGIKRVLNMIAGGLAGAAGHPEVGRELAEIPFSRAIADYNRKFAAGKEASDTATERATQGISAQNAIYNEQIKQLQVENADTRTQIEEQKAQIQGHAQEIKDAHNKALERAAQDRIDIQRMLIEVQKNKDPREMLGWLAGNDLKNDDLKEGTVAQRQHLWEEFKGKDTLDRIFQDSMEKEEGLIAGGGTPASIAANVAKITAISAAKGSWESLSDSEKDSVNKLVDQINADPMSYTDLTSKIPTKLKSHVMDRVDPGTSLRNWTADATNRRSRTSITRNHVQSALNLLEGSKTLQDNVGAIMGRALEGQSKLGDMPFLKTDEDKQKAQELLTLLGTEVGWEAAMLTGGRGGVRMVKFIQEFSPTAKLDYPVFKGAAQGMLQSVDNVLRGLSDPSGIYTNTPSSDKFGFVPGGSSPKGSSAPKVNLPREPDLNDDEFSGFTRKGK